ncbi:MAG: HYR domain-containing protein, partial [Bacteroidales bacterium]
TCATDKTQSADVNCESTVPDLTGEIVATDNGTIVSITQSPVAGTSIGLGVTTVTFTVTDDAGNTATCTADISVIDDEAPVLTGCPGNITVTADDEYCGNIATWVAPSASDNCSVILTSTYSSGDFFPVGTTTVTYTAEDPSGNIATCSFNVTILPATSPVLSGDTDVCVPAEVTYSTPTLATKSYQWTVVEGTISGSDTGSEISVMWSNTTEGTVTVTVTSGSGCSVSDSITIIKQATPVIGDIQSDYKLTRR